MPYNAAHLSQKTLRCVHHSVVNKVNGVIPINNVGSTSISLLFVIASEHTD